MRERAQRSLDATGSFVSARARLADARAERAGLLRQLARADTPNETASVRARLRSANRRISAARGSLARVDNRTRFASIDVSLVSDAGLGAARGDADGAWTPGDAAQDAARVLEVLASVAVLGLAVLGPFALVGAAAWLAVRFTTRWRRERALDAV